MTITSKREAARILRAEAESLRRHGFTNFFSHSFVCVLAQVLRLETCEGCLLRDYVPEEYRNEAFPCQHTDQASCERIAAVPGLLEEVAARYVSIAEELEARAEAEAARENP
ncbi:MAG: hypothetical protein ACE5HL_09300 [Terriglobia bacterium]